MDFPQRPVQDARRTSIPKQKMDVDLPINVASAVISSETERVF